MAGASHVVSWYLGTAQLTESYGIANRHGHRDRADAFRLLESAIEVGVDGFDTAQKYGEADVTIGEFARVHGIEVRVVTKIPGPVGVGTQRFVDEALKLVSACQERVHPARLEVVLFHDPETAVQHKNEVRAFDDAVKIDFPHIAIGASVYEPRHIVEDAWQGRAGRYQVPGSIVDRRFFSFHRESPGRIMFRSVFLQGLLVQRDIELPPSIRGHAGVIRRYHRLVANSGVNPVTAAISGMLHFVPDGALVIGAETPRQVRDIAGRFEEAKSVDPETLQAFVECTEHAPSELIDPRSW